MKQRIGRRLSREARWAALIWSTCAAVTIGVAATGALPNLEGPVASQLKTRKPIQKVDNPSQLRASTSDDRALANHFDMPGELLLDVGHVQLLIGRNENLTPPLPLDAMDPAATPVARRDPLQSVVCNSAAIVVGQVVASRAILNRSETYLVTTYTVAVSDWLRPRAGAATIEVAALGGEVQVGKRSLSARTAAVPLLAFETPVLLFVGRLSGATDIFALHSPAVRIDVGAIAPADLPAGGEDLAESTSLATVLARLRTKNLACADHK